MKKKSLVGWADKDWIDYTRYGVLDNEFGYKIHCHKNKYGNKYEDLVKVRITIEELK